MSQLVGFAGPSNVQFSRNVNAERTINRIPCWKDAGTPKTDGWLESAPGYEPFAGLGVGPVRALFAQDFGSGDRCFAVGGNVLYEVFPTHTATAVGTIAADGNPATITTNGTGGYQVYIVSGGLGYIYDLNTATLTQITAGGFPNNAAGGEFVGGYFLALQAHNNVWAFSAPEDGLDWPGLNFIQVSESTNIIRRLITNHNEVWNFGQFTTEIWLLDGSSSVFGPIQGTLIQQGIWAPWSAALADNSIFWIGGDTFGNGVVYRAQGYQPQVISNAAISTAMQALPRFDDAIGWTYQEKGHVFYVLYFPSGPSRGDHTTWVYDATTGLWHERGDWDDREVRFQPDRGRCHCFAFGQHLVGDRATATIYQMDQSIYDYSIVVG